MEVVKKILRVLGAVLGGGIALFGAVGLSTGEGIGIAIAFIVIGVAAVFFSLRRSPEARNEAWIQRQVKQAERAAAKEQARAEAAWRIQQAAEERQQVEQVKQAERAAAEERARAEAARRIRQAEEERQRREQEQQAERAAAEERARAEAARRIQKAEEEQQRRERETQAKRAAAEEQARAKRTSTVAPRVFGIVFILFGIMMKAATRETFPLVLFSVFGVFMFFFPEINKAGEEKKTPALNSCPTASNDNTPVCPRCGSAAISASKRGYKLGRGLFWGLVLGFAGFWLFVIPGALVGFALGLMAGSSGSQKVTVTCLNCGCQYNPALRHFLDEIKQGGTKAQTAPGPKAAQPRSGWDDPPIPPGFAEYLRETGQEDPRYSGRNNALECILIDMADDKERAVMWAYAVDCARHSRTMGNILHAPDYFKYRAFGEYASRHGDVLASIADRRAYEYWSPTTTTKAYRAAREFLG